MPASSSDGVPVFAHSIGQSLAFRPHRATDMGKHTCGCVSNHDRTVTAVERISSRRRWARTCNPALFLAAQ